MKLFSRTIRAAFSLAFLFILIPSSHAQDAGGAHYFSGGVRVELRPDSAWIAVKTDPGPSTANVAAELRKRLPVRAGAEGIENAATGVVVEAVEMRGAKFATGKAIRDEAMAVKGTRRTLRTFKNGKLPPIVDTGEICVRFAADIDRKDVERRLAAVRATIVRPLGGYAPNGYLAVVAEGADAIAAANELYGKPGVLFSHPNLIRPKKKAFAPNDPFYAQQWHLSNTGSNGTAGGTAGHDIKAERAWEITRGSSSVIVAVLDDGFDISHEDFASANKIAPGYDFLSNDSNPRPARSSDNHGTACAGLAVADGNNGVGVSGVAPDCRLMPIRMLGGQTDEAEAAAFNHAKNNGAAVLSCSYNYEVEDEFIPISDVINNAISDAADNGRGGKGCVIIFAAGNDTGNADFSGYNIHPKVITISASTNQGVISSYSNFGSSIDLSAPGGPLDGDMMTVDRTGNSGYTTGNYESAFNGTSAATPVVAGVAALLLSKEPNLTRAQVRQRLIDSSDFIGGVTYDENGHHDFYGFGRVNAWAALTWNDSSDPSIGIRLPGQGLSTTALAAADGTVTDAGTGVYQVMVAISDSQNRWWNWYSGGWSAPGSYIGSLDYHLKLATVTSGTWNINLPNLGAGSYRIHAKAIDNADNDSEFAFADFIIDPAGPQVTIGHPVANANYTSSPTASGTALDNIVSKRFALFRETDGLWYDWTGNSFDSPTFNGTSHVKILAESGLNWSLPLPAMNAGRYQLHALAFDSSGRSSDWVRRDFRINLPPVVTVNTPGHASSVQELGVISGDVTDTSGTGLVGNHVSFTLYQNGSYWTGTNWSSVQTALHAPISGTSWSYSNLPQGGNVRSGEYFISTYVVDNTGTTSTPTPGVNQTSFRLDSSPPEVAITAPVNGSTQNTQSYTFAGTVSDPGGVERVVLFIRRNADGRYWNGSGWIVEPVSANLASTYDSGTNTWLSNFTLPQVGSNSATQLANGSYNFIAIAIDLAGNSRQTDSMVTVDFHQTYHWTAGSHSDLDPNNNNFYWGNPANWSPAGVPGTEDIAVIALGHVVRSTVSRTVYGFHLSLGALDFDNAGDSLTITKNGTWTSGTLEDSVFIEPAATFAISSGDVKQIGNGGVIHNSGAVTWTGPGHLRGYQNSTWNNKPGSSFTMLTDGDLFGNHYSGNIFNNEGGAIFIKAAGDPGEVSTYIDEWTFNNHSKIECQQGTLHFNTTLNLNPGSNLAGAGRVLLNGTTNLAAVLSSTGNPELIGTLNGAVPTAAFTGSNPFVWSSGWINGRFDLTHGSVLELVTGNLKYLGDGAVFTNHGRVNWKAGLLRGYQNSTFNNESGAVFDAFTDGDIFSNHYSGNVFNNAAGALFIKSGKGSEAGAVSYVDEWTFNNSGVLRTDDGILQFHTVLNLNGGGTISRSGALPARVVSSHYFVLTGTTEVSNTTFETPGDWHGNLAEGTSGNGTLVTIDGGVFEWSGGTAHNTVTIAADSDFRINGNASKWLGDGAVINHHGNATWSGDGQIRGYQNSTFRNLSGATFTAATDADFTNHYSGNAFVNAAGATFSKTAGTDLIVCHWAFNNAGLVQSSSGSLGMYGGGASSGTFAPSAGGEIHFAGGQHDLLTNANCTGTGIVRVNGGTVHAVNSVNSDFNEGLLAISGGTVTSAIAGSFSVSGNIDWTGGTIAGVFNIAAGSDFSLDGGDSKWIGDGGVINNSGGATWNPPGLLRGYQNSTWNNKSGGSFTMTGDGDVLANHYGGNIFNNEAGASVIKAAGGAGEASSYIDEWTFNNNASLDCRQGTLHFNTTLNLGTGSSLLGAGRVLLNGTTNLSTLLTSTGNPELIGTLNGNTPAAGFSGSNPFIWSSGGINGAFSLQAGSVMDLITGNIKQIGDGSTFNNFGRVRWKAGLLRGYQNSTFNNESGAVFDAFTDGDVFANVYGGNVFNNTAGALFIKSGQSGTPDASTFIDEWTFNNSGAIRSDDGLLRFHTALNLGAGGSVARSGALPARVLSSHYLVLAGTTVVSNITFESSGDWHGNLTPGTAGNGTIATQSGGVFEWTGGTAHNTVNIAPGSAFLISGSTLKQIGDGGILKNSGIATRTGAGELRGYQNSSFVNLPGGVFHVMTSAPFTNIYGGNRLTNSGVMTIGASAGISPLHWSFTQTGTGRLNLEIGGTNTATPEFDQLHISGDANLAGTLGVSLINGYAPLAGTTFPVLTFGSRSGSFGSVSSPGLIWGTQHGSNDLTLVAKTYPTTHDEWTGYFFSDPESPDAQSFGNPDKDGLCNLLEYALGRDPHSGDGSGTSAGTVEIGGETYLTLTFIRPSGDAALTDVTYSGERSGSLSADSWAAAGVAVHSIVPVPGEPKETVTLRSVHPVGDAAKEFLHLKVGVGK